MTSPVIALVPLAAAFGTVATRGFRVLGTRLGVLSRPDPFVAQHTRPLPCLGGAALAVSAAATLLLDTRGANVTAAMLVGALLFLGTGLLDDVRGLRAAPKLALQVASASVAAALGLALPVSGNGVVDAAAGVLWVVVVVNAVNLTDVCDGLVAGLAVIALLALGATEPALRPVAFAVAGACLGFLVFNAPPATIFLGDAGSHFLGFVLGAVALEAARDPDSLSRLVANALIVGVPLFELAFVGVMRVHRGAPVWLGSADHFSLRLQAAGLSRWQTDAVAWAGAGTLAVVGWSFTRFEAVGRLSLVVCVLIALAAAGRVLLRWDATPSCMRAPTWRRPA